MNVTTLENVRFRADAKLRYAEIILGELKAAGRREADFDRAHMEAFLFHLWGAKEAFLLELNEYYSAGLNDEDVNIANLQNALVVMGVRSRELEELYRLEYDPESWFFHARRMRDYSENVDNLKYHLHPQGADDEDVWLHHSAAGDKTERHFTDEFSDWIVNMQDLLQRLRTSAIGEMRRALTANN